MNPTLEEFLWSNCIQDPTALDILFKLNPERYIPNSDSFATFKLFGFLGLKPKEVNLDEVDRIRIIGK